MLTFRCVINLCQVQDWLKWPKERMEEYHEWNTFFHIIICTNTLSELPVVDVSLCLKVPAIYSCHHSLQHVFTPRKFQRPSRRTIRCHVGQNSRCIVTNLVQQSHNTVYRTHIWHSVTQHTRVLQMLKAAQPFQKFPKFTEPEGSYMFTRNYQWLLF